MEQINNIFSENKKQKQFFFDCSCLSLHLPRENFKNLPIF